LAKRSPLRWMVECFKVSLFEGLNRLSRYSFAAALDGVTLPPLQTSLSFSFSFWGFSWRQEPRRFQVNVLLDLGPASEKWREEMAVMQR
jgi:hypothetical protein